MVMNDPKLDMKKEPRTEIVRGEVAMPHNHWIPKRPTLALKAHGGKLIHFTVE